MASKQKVESQEDNISLKKSERIAQKSKGVRFAESSDSATQSDTPGGNISDNAYQTAHEANSVSDMSDSGEVTFKKGAGEKAHNKGKYNDMKPAALIHTFGGELTEARHFISSFQAIAEESNWSETFKRQIFESKLTERARKTYFRGLGLNNELSMKQRIEAFSKIFSPTPDLEDEKDRFDSCCQEKGESVTAYKLRLDAQAKPMRKYISPAMIDQTLAHQFKKGIREDIKIDLYKSQLKGYERYYDLAMHLEQALNKLAVKKPVKVSSIEHAPEERQNKPSYTRQGPEQEISTKPVYYCTNCRIPGHSNQQCRRAANASTFTCFNCGKGGHTSRYCKLPLKPRGPIPQCENCKKLGHIKENCFLLLLKNKEKGNTSQNKNVKGNE